MDRTLRPPVVALMLAVVLTTVADAEPLWPGPPTDAVRRHLDEVLGIARNPALDADARQSAARAAVDRAFDFTDLSQRALGRHWTRMTRAEPSSRERFATS